MQRQQPRIDYSKLQPVIASQRLFKLFSIIVQEVHYSSWFDATGDRLLRVSRHQNHDLFRFWWRSYTDSQGLFRDLLSGVSKPVSISLGALFG